MFCVDLEVDGEKSEKKYAIKMSAVLLLLIVAAFCDSAVIDSDSPSPASQRLVSSQAIESDYSSELFSQKRPMETIDDLMNALAQVTKSKGK